MHRERLGTDVLHVVPVVVAFASVAQQLVAVNLEGNAAAVQTDDSTLSTVLDAAKIRELPLPGNRRPVVV